MTDFRNVLLATVATACLIGVGCAKKTALAPPPPAPQPAVSAANRTPEPAATPYRAPATTNSAPAASNSRYPDAATRARIDALLARISDAYFDYDKHDLRPDALSTLHSDSVELRDILKQYPDYKLVIEGHCDERGSEEYNIGLGDARAQSARTYLVQVGIPSTQLSVVSYGKDRPVCSEHDEACWQKNRRIHIIPAANQPTA